MNLELIEAVVFILIGFSIFPLISFGVANTPSSYRVITDPFDRPDSSIYFTDQKIIELRMTYQAEFNSRLKQTIVSVIFYIATIYYIDSSKSGITTEQPTLAAFGFAFIHLFNSIYFFGRLGASYAKLSTTKLLDSVDRKKMEAVILNSSHPDELISFLNENPKPVLAYIDFLNVSHKAELIKKREEKKRIDTTLRGLTK